MALVSDPLITAEALKARLAAGDVRPVDASWWFAHEKRDARAEFETAHVPGAVFFDIDAISDPVSPLPHMLPSPDAFAAAMSALGLGDGRPIVVYETGAPRSAARAWWSLRAMGHEQVTVLDGGLSAWRAAGGVLESGPARPLPARFTSRPRPELIADLAVMRALAATGGRQILDARPAARFQGAAPEPREGLRSGHIPGALSLPASELFDEAGRLLEPAHLRRRIQAAGADPDASTVATCGSGITACCIALAFARLGRPEVAVYDGSWAEWGSLRDAPVATGP